MNKIKKFLQNEENRILVWAGILAIIIFSTFSCERAGAEVIKKEDAVKAIIGEASNQGYRGMLAVACGIRNRGTLKGIYGLKAKHIYKEPMWVWDMARRAWKESEHNDIVFGATNWENIKAFGEPFWAKKMTKTVKIKDHSFYKK